MPRHDLALARRRLAWKLFQSEHGAALNAAKSILTAYHYGATAAQVLALIRQARIDLTTKGILPCPHFNTKQLTEAPGRAEMNLRRSPPTGSPAFRSTASSKVTTGPSAAGPTTASLFETTDSARD